MYLKIFGQDGLGRPDLEAQAETAKVRNYLSKLLPAEKIPNINAVLAFIHPKASLVQPEDELPAYPFVAMDKLKEIVRKSSKGKGGGLTNTQVNELRAAFENPQTLGAVEKIETPAEPEPVNEVEAADEAPAEPENAAEE